MTAYQDLKNWLERNQERLRNLSLEEIADLAILCGLDRAAVAQWRTAERYRRIIP